MWLDNFPYSPKLSCFSKSIKYFSTICIDVFKLEPLAAEMRNWKLLKFSLFFPNFGPDLQPEPKYTADAASCVCQS